jgi:signal-transduction protein with cAMP-binding, CBS, and nucleotidyltransferase domain
MMEKHTPHRFVKDQTSKSQEIADWMSYPVINVDAAFTVKETAQLMHDKNIGSVLVEENSEYVGIVTETDLTRKVLVQGLCPNTSRVSEIMTQPIISLDCHLPVTEANAYMAKKKMRHLAITDNGKIVGMISVRDLVSFFANPRFR